MILTTLPPSWSTARIRNEFQVSFKTAKRAQYLQESRGFMSAPTERLRRNQLDEHTIDVVRNFYLDDENSRVCPGKRDYVIVNMNGEKVKKQRRLLLFTLNEGYAR